MNCFPKGYRPTLLFFLRTGFIMISDSIYAFSAQNVAFAQDPALSCKYYDAQCRGGTASLLCIQLQRRCGAAANKVIPNQQPSVPGGGEQPARENLLEMPECGPDEELVRVPTCMCGVTGDQQGPTAGESDCDS